jgi:serine phosphatase RsbU (regulator of sigma subunit)
LALVLVRGFLSLAAGRHGEAWPFAVLLASMTAYEWWWLRFIKNAIAQETEVSATTWTASVFLECLLPTIALILEIHTKPIGPERALESPVVLVYLLFILLSTLHLNPRLCRLAGAISAAGYAAVAVYASLRFPDVAAAGKLLVYGTFFSYTALLLIGGVAAGAVAHQIRLHVLAALREAETRAKVAALEHDLEIARSIQQGLLPASPPQVDRFDIAGWNKPADETGGDYYDWQQLPDGRITVTIADVTGHGIGSALCMAACRSYARVGFVIEPDLSKLLGRMSELLYKDLPTEKFVTLAAGILNPQDATLQLASAGHGPILFYSAAEDRFTSLDAQGPPLGLLPRISYGAPKTMNFGLGDILVLVTDGFVEWANTQDEDFGADRLMEVVRASRGKPAATIISDLYSAVLKFAGSIPQADDLTALVVRRL